MTHDQHCCASASTARIAAHPYPCGAPASREMNQMAIEIACRHVITCATALVKQATIVMFMLANPRQCCKIYVSMPLNLRLLQVMRLIKGF